MEDLGDSDSEEEDSAEEAAEEEADRVEEQREVAEEAAEEAAEESAEEEEEELEAAEEDGLLVGIQIRQRFFRLGARIQRLARGTYFHPLLMTPRPVVPGPYTEGGIEKADSVAPYYYGPAAVDRGEPLDVASVEHYAERSDTQTIGSCARRSDRQLSTYCENVTKRALPLACDRYELVPALALITPEEPWRWPLQMRIHSARVYTNRSLVQDMVVDTSVAATASQSNLPFLVHFDPAGFIPQTAFSEDAISRRERSVPASLPALILLVFGVTLLTLACGECPERTPSASKLKGQPGSRRALRASH